MSKFLFILNLMFLCQLSFSQNDSLLISTTFQPTSFEEFVSSIESKTDFVFFYDPDLVKNLQVNISESGHGLSHILTEIFASSQLKFFIDLNNNVIIYTGNTISSTLPKYQYYNNVNSTQPAEEDEVLTEVEKNYSQGRKIKDLELIVVGNKQENNQKKTSILSGRIVDQSSGETLPGATVFVKELGLGAATDIDGHFILTIKPGKYLVVASCLSMKEKKFYVQVNSDGFITVPMDSELINIKEVTVSANRNDNTKGMQMGFEHISMQNIKEIPAVMGERDILKVAQLLPGVQSAGEGAAGLNVRGGTADQNLFYINKMPVYNTAHLFGFFTAFNPDLVNDFTLYKSNVPANYGGRVSSVFDISTRQGNKKEFYGKGGISPITAHALIEGPIVKDKTSFVLSARGSYSDWILSRMKNLNLKNSKASFYDFAGVVNTEINGKNIIKLFAYASHDRFSLTSSDDYNYSNTGGTLNLKRFFSSSLTGDLAAVYSQYAFGHTFKKNPSDTNRHEYLLQHAELKADFTKATNTNHRILFGGSSILYKLQRGNVLPYGEESTKIPIFLGSENANESAIYISDEFSLFPKLTALIGLRYSLYSLFGPDKVYEYFSDSRRMDNIRDTITFRKNKIVKFYHGLEPRIALNYKLGPNNSLKASYNRTKQYIFLLSNTFAISPTDQWKLADYYLKPPTNDQVSLGYYHDSFYKGIVTSLEIYKKWSRNAVEYKDGADFISGEPAEQTLVQGNLDSYGVEAMIKKNSGKLTGWIAYTYSRSFMQISNNMATEQINGGKKYPSNFDRPHSINLVLNKKSNRRLSISSNLVYATGRPFTVPVGVYNIGEVQAYVFSERNKYRIPDYFRIDASINIEGNLVSKKWLHSYFMLSAYNLTGRKNAYSIYFENNDEGQMQGYKLSVYGQPIFTISWNYKFGNYSSK